MSTDISKNPYFLIDVFEQIALRKENAKFVWAGTGELEIEIKQYAESKKLGSKILFIGNRGDMAGVYSMMDCFILPSRYEGLGIVFVEAQACGVPVYASDVVPKDVMMTHLMHYISLKKLLLNGLESLQRIIQFMRSEVCISRR